MRNGFGDLDTYAKGIAAGHGDESLAKDQNATLANLRRVLDNANVHIATVGHTGKDQSKGERGSNAKLADVDLLVQISGDIIKTATVKKANDQPEGALTSFRLEPYDFGLDEDGDISHHPARVIAPRLPPLAEPSGSSRFDPVGPCSTAMTCLLCSTGITPLHNYYEAVRPSPAHRYFGLRGWSRLRLFP